MDIKYLTFSYQDHYYISFKLISGARGPGLGQISLLTLLPLPFWFYPLMYGRRQLQEEL